MNDASKSEKPFALDIGFDEALARYIQTKPEEVEPAPGQKRKTARPSKGPGGSRLSPTGEDEASASASGSPHGSGEGS